MVLADGAHRVSILIGLEPVILKTKLIINETVTFYPLTLVDAQSTMSTRPCQRRGTRPRGLLGPSGAVLPVVTFSPTINSLSRVDFALGATNSAR